MWLLVEQGKNNQVKDFFHALLAPFTLKPISNAEQPGCAGQIDNCQLRLTEHFPLDTTAQDTVVQCGIHIG